MAEDIKMYNPHDGLTGRDGGPYLDQVENEAAEIRRAKIEDREPDLVNPPPAAGTPLVTGPELVKMANPASNPSQQGNDVVSLAIDNVATNEDFAVQSVASIPAENLGTVENVVPENANEDPTNPTGATSWPAQTPNADVTGEASGDTSVADPAASNDSGAPSDTSDTPIFSQVKDDQGQKSGAE